MAKIVLPMMLIGSCNLVIYTYTNAHGHDDMKTFPAYLDPNHFAKGQRVAYGEFEAVIVRHYHEGMWEIRMSSGMTCVSGSYLKPIN